MGQIKFLGMLIAALLANVYQSKADAVSETVCVVNIDTACTVENSECNDDAQSPKCKCSDGYKEDTNDKSTCVKIPVSETSCADNGEADCKDAHSECDGAQTQKCKCSDGYKEDSNDKSTCVKIPVSETPCSDNTQCKDAHSECDNVPNRSKCKCSDGYKEDSTDGSTCETIPAVLDTACPNGVDECTAASSVCDGADTSPKCKCSVGFRQDTKDHTKCKKELGQACSEGECLTNAQCDTTCKCSDEHIEKDGLCVVPSSTIKAGLSEIVMMMWVLCVIILTLF